MRTSSLILATALTLGFGGLALAGGRDAGCAAPDRPVASAGTVLQTLEGLGYRVDRIQAEHGCFEVRAVNDSGYPIRAVYDAGGELVRARLR